MSQSITPRPDYHDPCVYLDHVARCLSAGHEPFAPATLDELHAALDQWPQYARRWLPPIEDCERYGIDPTIGQTVEPLTEHEQERLVMTLRDDADFRAALRAMIGGAA